MTGLFKSASIRWSAFLFSFIVACNSLCAQNTEQLYKATSDTLLTRFNHIQEHPWLTDEVNADNTAIVAALENFLKQKDAFDFRFDLGKNLSDIVSADKKLRIISWTLPPHFGVYRCYGFVLYKNPKTKNTSVFKLKAAEEKTENTERKSFNHLNWQSCVYYNLIQKKNKGKMYYTLLGWSGNDGITTKKIIDVLTFSTKGEPVFGAPVFLMKKEKWQRIIFEYSPQATMYLNYDEQKKMILFDHLAPNDPVNTGRFQYYGPDFSVDGLKWKKGMWMLTEDVDAKNKD
ncbi:MAG: hypothetical protein POELPBGB_02822 [Bacteroidia bacterium]|nr:hypothetical protein [Bacteroidia bacterium]